MDNTPDSNAPASDPVPNSRIAFILTRKDMPGLGERRLIGYFHLTALEKN